MNDELKIENSVRNDVASNKKNLTIKNYRRVVYVFLAFCAVLVGLRIYTIENSVKAPGFLSKRDVYELEETLYTNVFMILYALGVVGAFVIGFLYKNIGFGVNKRSDGFVFISSLAGFCMVGCAGFFVYRSTLIESSIDKLGYSVIIFMLFTGVYFAIDAVGFVTEKTRPWFSIIVVIFGVLRLLSDFFKLNNYQTYSSNEYHFISLVATLMFFCCNARFQIEETSKTGYPFFGLFASMSLLVYALPEIYISLFQPYYVDSVFIFSVVDAVLAFYIIAKLLSVREPVSALTVKKDDAECDNAIV